MEKEELSPSNDWIHENLQNRTTAVGDLLHCHKASFHHFLISQRKERDEENVDNTSLNSLTRLQKH